MSSYREIERKLVVGTDQTLEQVVRDVSALLRDGSPQYATSRDLLWAAPHVDFLRLRASTKEMTVKASDRGSTLNRLEVNVEVIDLKDAEKLASSLFGEPKSLVKDYALWAPTKLPDVSAPVVVCAYRVHEDPEKRVFVEVEGPDERAVEEGASYLSRYLKLVPEGRSLFQIFLEEVE